MVAEAGCQGGAPGEWRGCEGRPAPEKGTQERRLFVRKPVAHLRKRVFQGACAAMGAPHLVADHAATLFAELLEGAHGGAVWRERLQRVAMGEQQCELACGIGGVIFGPTGCEGVAVARQRQGIEGEEDQKVIRAPGEDQGTFVKFAADRHGVAVEPRAQGGDPRVDGLGRVLELQARPLCGARSLEAPIVLGIRPIDTHKGSTCVRGARRHVSSPSVGESGTKGHGS